MADVQGVPEAVLQQAVQRGVHSLVAVMDETGAIVFTNDAFRSIGFEPGEVNGQYGMDFVHPDDVERAASGITTLLETGTSVPTPFRMRRADGGYEVFDVASSLIRHDDRDWMVADFRPIPFHMITADTLGALARGEPAEVAIGALASALSQVEAFDCQVGVAIDDDQGRRVVVGPLDPILIGVAPGDVGPNDGIVTVDDMAELARANPGVHGRAATLGLVAATFGSVHDPGSSSPVVVALWYRSTTRKQFLDLYFEQFALDLVRIALQGRHERRQLEHLAHHDPLTGLANRSSFLSALDSLTAARRTGDPGSLAVIYVDLDDFKPVNDTHGHAAGDALLEAVARRFRHVVRPDDVVARLGGDEFAVLCPGIASEDEALQVARRLVAAAAEPFVLADDDVRVGASAGVAFAPDAQGQQGLLTRADDALYRAKRSRKGSVAAAPA